MEAALIANACAYLGMLISLAGIKAKRDTQKWCYFIGPIFMLVGAYLLGNWVLTLLQAIIVLAGLGGILNVPPKFSWVIIFAGAASIASLWQMGLVRPDWSITGPVGLVAIALGVALAPHPVSAFLLLVGGLPLLIFSAVEGLWGWVVFNLVWSAMLLHTLYFKKRPRA
ncbi:MAG: hypothetical protein Q8Q41_03880 [bacterium]|nr:hypothetical protein [bacterium]